MFEKKVPKFLNSLESEYSSGLVILDVELKKSTIMTKNKETWQRIIQLIVSILTAALTALGTTSCMGHGPIFI